MRAPTLPSSTLGAEWRQVRTQTEDELALPVFAVRSHSRLFEHADTAARVAPVGGRAVDMPPRAVFATALEFEPSFAELGVDPASRPVFAVARRRARTEFANSLAEDGIPGVDHADSRWLDRTDGRRARAFRYDVGYPLDRTLVRGTGEPTLRGVLWAGIWPTEEAYAMAGGVYPAETLAAALDRQGARLTDDGVDLETVVEPDRERDRKTVGRVIQAADAD